MNALLAWSDPGMIDLAGGMLQESGVSGGFGALQSRHGKWHFLHSPDNKYKRQASQIWTN